MEITFDLETVEIHCQGHWKDDNELIKVKLHCNVKKSNCQQSFHNGPKLKYAFDIEKEQLQGQDQNWKSPWIELINTDLYVKVWRILFSGLSTMNLNATA